MTKTTKEWFELLPEPYRTQALMNTPYGEWRYIQSSLADAIAYGFTWSCSPEGSDYWEGVTNRADKGEFNPAPPEPSTLNPTTPLPEGFDRWEYRGKGWRGRGVYTAYLRGWFDEKASSGDTLALARLHYWEAVKSTKDSPTTAGYRLLGPGDVVRDGDEWYCPSSRTWGPVISYGRVEYLDPLPRRRAISSYQDA